MKLQDLWYNISPVSCNLQFDHKLWEKKSWIIICSLLQQIVPICSMSPTKTQDGSRPGKKRVHFGHSHQSIVLETQISKCIIQQCRVLCQGSALRYNLPWINKKNEKLQPRTSPLQLLQQRNPLEALESHDPGPAPGHPDHCLTMHNMHQ